MNDELKDKKKVDRPGIKEVNGVRYFTLKYVTTPPHKLASRSTLKRKIKAREIQASVGIDGQTWIPEKELERFLKKNPAA